MGVRHHDFCTDVAHMAYELPMLSHKMRQPRKFVLAAIGMP